MYIPEEVQLAKRAIGHSHSSRWKNYMAFFIFAGIFVSYGIYLVLCSAYTKYKNRDTAFSTTIHTDTMITGLGNFRETDLENSSIPNAIESRAHAHQQFHNSWLESQNDRERNEYTDPDLDPPPMYKIVSNDRVLEHSPQQISRHTIITANGVIRGNGDISASAIIFDSIPPQQPPRVHLN